MSQRPKPAIVPSVLKWALCGLSGMVLFPLMIIGGLLFGHRATPLFVFWCALCRRIFGVTVVIDDPHGVFDGDGHYVFVMMNQSSLFDTFMITSTPVRGLPLMNIGYALVPGLGWALWAMGGLVVVRQWPAQARRAIDRCVARVSGGASIFISIEGRRSPGGALAPYKKGPVVLAIRSGVAMVPTYLYGTHDLLPYGEWRVRPGKTKMRFGAPINVEGKTYDEREALLRQLEDLAEAELGARPPPAKVHR